MEIFDNFLWSRDLIDWLHFRFYQNLKQFTKESIKGGFQWPGKNCKSLVSGGGIGGSGGSKGTYPTNFIRDPILPWNSSRFCKLCHVKIEKPDFYHVTKKKRSFNFFPNHLSKCICLNIDIAGIWGNLWLELTRVDSLQIQWTSLVGKQ